MTEDEYLEIKFKWNSFGWYPNELTTKGWDVSWEDMPKEMLEWIRSLKEFDAGIFEKITGIKAEQDKKKELLDKAEELIVEAKELKEEARKL